MDRVILLRMKRSSKWLSTSGEVSCHLKEMFGRNGLKGLLVVSQIRQGSPVTSPWKRADCERGARRAQSYSFEKGEKTSDITMTS